MRIQESVEQRKLQLYLTRTFSSTFLFILLNNKSFNMVCVFWEFVQLSQGPGLHGRSATGILHTVIQPVK